MRQLVKQSIAGEAVALGSEIINDENFRKLAGTSYAGITLIDENMRIFYRSPSAETMAGRKNSQTQNTRAYDLVHREDAEKVEAAIKRALLFPGESQNCEFRTIHADGHYMTIECTFSNMLDKPGINAVVCNWHDITKRKSFERSLEHANSELQDYRHALDECAIITITDSEGKISYVNDKFCKVSQYSREELLGQNHRIINSGYHGKEFFKTLWDTISQGNVWRGEVRNKAKDGTFHWVDATVVPFLKDDGLPYSYVAIRFDITNRKNGELELSKLNNELRQKYDQLMEISWLQSHVIRAPLARIMGLLPLMKEGKAEEKELIFDYMLQSAKDLDGVIKKITTLSDRANFLQ